MLTADQIETVEWWLASADLNSDPDDLTSDACCELECPEDIDAATQLIGDVAEIVERWVK